jgi:hypothetical protein
MRCFQGFQQILAGFYPKNVLFSLTLQRDAVMMTLFSRSTKVEQLPAATIDPLWQVSHGFWNMSAVISPRIAAGAHPNDELSSPRDHAEPGPNAGSGSSADARPAAQLALQPPKKQRKLQSKSYLFRDEHCRTYGLKVKSLLTSNGHVDSVQCRFCVVFGREAKEAAKRGKTENSKFLTLPFRPDNYVTHLKSTHAARWDEYSKLSDIEKAAYFSSTSPVENTMLAHVDTILPLPFIINGEIVDGLIGDPLFDPDDDAVTRDTVLRAFKLADPALASLRVACPKYHVEVKNGRQYQLCVGFVGHSYSFHQAVSMDAHFDNGGNWTVIFGKCSRRAGGDLRKDCLQRCVAETERHPWRVVGILCCLGQKHGGGHGIYGRENSRLSGWKDNQRTRT